MGPPSPAACGPTQSWLGEQVLGPTPSLLTETLWDWARQSVGTRPAGSWCTQRAKAVTVRVGWR